MFRSFAGRAVLLVTLGAALPAGAQRAAPDLGQSAPISAVRYEITADRARLGQRQLRVATTFTVGGTAPVLLSLPAWTPGAYDIANFARTVGAFAALQGADSLRWDKADYDTWRLWPKAAGQVTVAFDVIADTLDNAMSWTRPDFALFNGTNVFVYPEGRPMDFAATVVIRTEPDFLVATGMPRAPEARTYRAANYHELVDMPFFVGQFELDSAVVSGKTVRFATYPRGAFSSEARTTAWDQIKRSIPPQVQVFGDVPWDTYTVMHITDSTAQGMSGLEHANSHVDITVPRGIGSEFQPSLIAHEIFHAWNVKRLRPADLVPYRYDRPQQTTWLWVSEGVTDYYADLTLVRGGIIDANGFYAATTQKIGEIAAAPPFALEDASLSAWISARDGTDALYYPKGSLAGFLLDIMIRDASDNRRYIDGRDPYPWDEALKLVGLRLQPDSVPRMGVSLRPEPDGNGARIMEIVPGSPALEAGIRVGDVIATVNERPAMQVFFGGGFRAMYGNQPAGTRIPVVIRRDGATVNIQVPLRFGLSEPRLVEDPAATPRAVRLRNGLLRGTTDK